MNVETVRAGKIPAYRFWILFVNVAAYVAFFVTYQITAAMGSIIMEEMNISATQLTAFGTACMLGFAVGPIVGAYPNRKYGARLNVTVWLIGLALSSLLILAVRSNYTLMVGVRFLQGMCGGLLVPSAVGSVNAWFPRKEAGVASGLLIGILGVGMTIAHAIVIPMSEAGISWYNCVVYPSVILSLVVAVIYFLTVKNFGATFPGYDKLSQIIETEENAPAKVIDTSNMPDTMSRFLRTKVFWCMAAYCFIKCMFTYGLSALFPQLLSIEKGLDMSVVSAVTSKTFFITVIGAPLGGVLSGYLCKGKRYPIMVAGAALTVITLLLIPRIENITALNVVLFLCYGSTAIGTGCYWALSTECVHPKIAADSNGLLSGIANAGGTIAPIMLVAMASSIGSYSICFYILAACAAIQLVASWLIHK